MTGPTEFGSMCRKTIGDGRTPRARAASTWSLCRCAIIDAAALSFLGLGNPDDTRPEWGQMLGRAQQYFNTHPEVAVYPALCIIVVALGFTLMGESLREALDPKSRR